MPLHAQRQGFQAAHGEKTVERSCDRADGVLQKRNLIAELFVFADDDDAAHQVRVAI